MPFDKNSRPKPRPQDASGPLSEFEQKQLARLLARRGITPEQAEAEAAEQRKLEAQRAAMLAEEEKLAARLGQLHSDIDRVTEKLGDLTNSGVARRAVAGQLRKFAELAASQSFFNTSHDTLDRAMIENLAEIGLAVYEQRPSGKLPPLRERMANVNPSVGLDPPQEPDNPTTAVAAAILRAGRRRRGEEP